MDRVVYYARVSTEEEQQASALVTQCMENEEFIKKKKDWVLVDKYIDEGKSGTTTEGRKEFIRMLSDMKDDKFDVILIKQIDRGWRNLGDWKIFEQQLLVHKKKLFIRLKNDYYNVEDDGSYISTTMDSMFAEWYSRNLSKKLNVAHKTRMKKGTIVTNGKLWGYDQVNADLVINEKEAEVVRYVFNAYIQGKGFRTIARELENMGIKSRAGTPFALTTLKRMIKNEKYKGTLICGKTHKNFFTKKIEKLPESEWIIHEDRIPPIVTKEIWQKANDILIRKRKKYNREDKPKVAGYFNGTYPLSGKIKCSECGKKYYHGSYKNKNSPKREVWQCSTYKNYGKKENGCSNISLKCEELSEIVKEIIFEMWQNKDNEIIEVLNALEKIVEQDNNQYEIDKLKKELEKMKIKQNKLFDLYTDDIISKVEFKEKNDEIMDKTKNIEEQLEKLLQKTLLLKNKKQRMEKIKEFFTKDLKDINSITDKIIENMVEEIIVYPNRKLDITINGKKFPNVTTTR